MRVFASRSSKAKIKAKSVLLEKRHADQDIVGVGRGYDRFGGTWIGEKEVALLQPSWGRGFVPRDDGAGDHVGFSFSLHPHQLVEPFGIRGAVVIDEGDPLSGFGDNSKGTVARGAQSSGGFMVHADGVGEPCCCFGCDVLGS